MSRKRELVLQVGMKKIIGGELEAAWIRCLRKRIHRKVNDLETARGPRGTNRHDGKTRDQSDSSNGASAWSHRNFRKKNPPSEKTCAEPLSIEGGQIAGQ